MTKAPPTLAPLIETAPYFSEGPTQLAKMALDAGDPAKAIDLLRDARHVAARALPARAGDVARGPSRRAASDELHLLAVHYTPMRDRCLFDAGQVDEARKQPLEAEVSYAQVSSVSAVFADARFAMSRLLKVRGQFVAAAEALLPLATADVPERVRGHALWERSELAHATHDSRAERDTLTQLALSASLRWARSAWTRLGAMPAQAMLSQADLLLDRGKCSEAARTAERALSQDKGCLARIVRAEADACRGKDTEAELRALTVQCAEPDQAARAWMNLGLLQGRREQWDAAASSLRQTARLMPDTAVASEGLFQAFWVGWKHDPKTAAVGDLAQLESMRGLSGQDRARAKYWRARAALAQGTPVVANALMSEVALDFPATFYGRLARLAPRRS